MFDEFGFPSDPDYDATAPTTLIQIIRIQLPRDAFMIGSQQTTSTGEL